MKIDIKSFRKTLKYLTIVLTLLMPGRGIGAPLVYLVGIAGSSPPGDGFSFVALSDIPAGTIFYATDNAYNNVGDVFIGGEEVFVYTSQGLSCSDVVSIHEITANLFTITCTACANCGTFAQVINNWSVGSGTSEVYLYSDGDNDPTNGITETFSAVEIGAFAAGENPATDFPDAMVIDDKYWKPFHKLELNKQRYE